ncbi:MAG: hypothetical protein EA398_17480 [Deltaproteobacteria bacterium]|nr:MAG: hypothetical protein EA398_17480 [Deltaproteobacteria bacterium]
MVTAALETALLAGRGGGPRDMSVVRDDCSGWVTNAPGAVLDVRSQVPLRVRLSAPDSPLVSLGLVLEPLENGTESPRPGQSGSGVCVPPAPQGSAQDIEPLDEGRWVAWVSTARPEQTVAVRVSVERADGTPDPARQTRDVPAGEGVPARPLEEGTFGGVVMGANTRPVLLEGRAGGPRPAEGLGLRCAGWIAEVPDHVLVLERTLPLRLVASAPEGIVLAVRLEDGTWICSDEDEVREVRVGVAIPAGRHEIFVASLDPHQDPEYTLAISR